MAEDPALTQVRRASPDRLRAKGAVSGLPAEDDEFVVRDVRLRARGHDRRIETRVLDRVAVPLALLVIKAVIDDLHIDAIRSRSPKRIKNIRLSELVDGGAERVPRRGLPDEGNDRL